MGRCEEKYGMSRAVVAVVLWEAGQHIVTKILL
jgi:hypothetical protein